jgi:hypothetical protein
LIVCVFALAAIVVVAGARYLVRDAELAAESARDARAAETLTAQIAHAAEIVPPAETVFTGPPEGARVAVHVDGRVVQGKRTRVGDPAAEGWVVLGDGAVVVTGQGEQPLGGHQWFREDRVTQVQEL